jgi:hypothetical protein
VLVVVVVFVVDLSYGLLDLFSIVAIEFARMAADTEE